MDPRLAELAAFGLNEPQIAAYVYLLKRDAATAPEVASGAGIPRNRAYEVLDSLAALGLVQVVAGTKRNYKALAIGPFLARRVREAQTDLDRLKERAPTLERELVPTVDAQGFLGAFSTWRGTLHVSGAAKRLALEAESCIHILAPPVGVHRFLVPMLGDLLESRRRAGIDVRLLVTLCDQPSFDPLLDVPFRTSSGGGSITKMVVDRRALLIRSTDGRSDDEAYEMRHEGLAAEAVSLFEHLWACPAASKEAQNILRVPREGEGSTPVRAPDTSSLGVRPRPDASR